LLLLALSFRLKSVTMEGHFSLSRCSPPLSSAHSSAKQARKMSVISAKGLLPLIAALSVCLLALASRHNRAPELLSQFRSSRPHIITGQTSTSLSTPALNSPLLSLRRSLSRSSPLLLRPQSSGNSENAVERREVETAAVSSSPPPPPPTPPRFPVPRMRTL